MLVTKALNYKVTRGPALEVMFRQRAKEKKRKKKKHFLFGLNIFDL